MENLPSASLSERWFKELGFPDSIRYQEKTEQLLRSGMQLDIADMKLALLGKGLSTYLFNPNLYRVQLLDEFPHAIWHKRFPTQKIKHFLVFPDVGYPNLQISEFSIKGRVYWFQGPMVISAYRNKYFITNLNDLLHREVAEIRKV